MKEVRDFCGKLILESAKAVCSCTILCLNSKTVTALGEIYGTGFLDRGSTPLISTKCYAVELSAFLLQRRLLHLNIDKNQYVRYNELKIQMQVPFREEGENYDTANYRNRKH